MEAVLHYNSDPADNFFISNKANLSEIREKAISELMYMTMLYNITLSEKEKTESVATEQDNSHYQQNQIQSFVPNIPNLSDLVSDCSNTPIHEESSEVLQKPRKKSMCKNSTCTTTPCHENDVRALIKEKMNIDQSSPAVQQRIAEQDAFIQRIMHEASLSYDTGDDSVTNYPGDVISDTDLQDPSNTEDEKGQPRLWNFIFKLLEHKEANPLLVRWVHRTRGEFEIVSPKHVAVLWGRIKNNEGMNYEKLSRGLRYYYKTGVLERVHGRLQYKWGEKAKIWNHLKKSRSIKIPQKCKATEQNISMDISQNYLLPDENANHFHSDQFADVLDSVDLIEPTLCKMPSEVFRNYSQQMQLQQQQQQHGYHLSEAMELP